MEVKQLGNIFGYTGGNFSGNVYDKLFLSPTLNTMQGGNKQPMIIESVRQLGFMDNGTGQHQSNTVYDENTLCPSITTVNGGGTQQIKICTESKEEPSFRIRKLTPKECYRLMGFDDEAFERAEQVNSNTQLYKQAGNSIVVDVLMAIFDNLLVHSRSVWLDELLKYEEDKNNENN